MTMREWARASVAEAIGQAHRDDPVVASSGGPAGNALLTAWIGAALLVLFVVELATLLDVTGLLSWHVIVGVLLVPPALVKTGTTGWRIVRYYTHSPAYRQAGPPPMMLRVLGPLVVLFTLAVLGTGLALLALGPNASLEPFLSVLGYQVSALTLHQATFIVWAVVTGLHVLGRLVPATRIISGHQPVPGTVARVIGFMGVAVTAALAAVLIYGASTSWLIDGPPAHHHHVVVPHD
ncbi:MAG TPA: hypothetical protein VG247_08265 [Pseudonocardiaceae bacterium]|jgi:hypothetical protein|nr:hypothetical protein [Pseudonocardiaceae bacterium]